MTKGTAFILCFFAILFIFAAMFVVALIDKNYSLIPVSQCLTALVSITGAYIGLQIVNNGVKGKCWNNDMYEHENQRMNHVNMNMDGNIHQGRNI